ncbi:hypothetical protein BC941DRAFT_212274 [Chlamydoabsidia padenii]|nr:hypothetical protein BC941DRAFT_212274 [Chlamydoabsidia padenii]
MLKVIGDFFPYGSEFINRYPHLMEGSQSSRSSKDVDFSKLLDITAKRNTSPHLQSAQSYRLSSVPCSNSKSTTEELRNPTVPQLESVFPVDEELYVQNNTVIWSRGRHIIKTFKYELQSVDLALFAWFPVEQLDIDGDDHTFAEASKKRKQVFGEEQSLNKKRQSTISAIEFDKHHSEEHTFQHTTTPFAPFSKKDTCSDQTKNIVNTFQKAACILLKDCIKIHFMDGKLYSIHLPFTTRQVIPSDVGLIFERTDYTGTSTTYRRHKNNNSTFADRMTSYTGNHLPSSPATSANNLKASPFLCLVHPAEDLKPIFFVDEFSGLGSTYFQQQQLVYASFTMDYTYDKDTRLPTLMVTKSRDTGLHSVWRYQSVKHSEIDSSDEDTFGRDTKSSMRAPPFPINMEDQHHQPKKEQDSKLKKQSKRSKKSGFSIKSSRRRPKKQQKEQQRQQSSPPSPHGDNSSSGVPCHSPSPSPSLTTRKDSFLAASWSFLQNDEDTSNTQLDDNGDSYSMMALYQDALNTEKGEKNLLHLIWLEQRHSLDTNLSTVSKAFISHNGEGLAVLCIMNETEGTLLGLLIKDLLSCKHLRANIQQKKGYPVAGFQLAVKQALPIHNATRAGGLADILYLDHQGNMFLFIDPKSPSLPLSPHPEKNQRNNPHQQISSDDTIIKLQDAVDNRFNMIISGKDSDGLSMYSIKRCQIKSVSLDFHCKSSNRNLVVNGNMALRCAWSSSLLWFFFQYQSLQMLQKQQDDNFDGWEVFVLTLVSMIPLSMVSPCTSTTAASTTLGAEYDEKVMDFYIHCLHKAYQTQTRNKQQAKEEMTYISESKNIASVVYALHVLHQEYRLSKFISKETLLHLGTLLWTLSQIVKSDRWVDFYRSYGSSEGIIFQLDTTSLQDCPPFGTTLIENDGLISLDCPFHFESWVHYYLPHNYTASLHQLCGVPTLDPDAMYKPSVELNDISTDIYAPMSKNNKIRRSRGEFGFKLKMIWYIHQTMYYHLPNAGVGDYSSESYMPPSSTPLAALPKSFKIGQQEWIKAVMNRGYCRNDLEMVPDSCILLVPLLDAITQLQLNPPTNQSMDFYKFIGRYDMVTQLDYFKITSTLNNTNALSSYQSKLIRYSPGEKNCQQRKTVILNCQGPDLIPSQLSYTGSTSTLDKLKHVRTMLNPCRLVEITVPDWPGLSQDSVNNIIQGYLKQLIQRTLALPIGNGIFHYGHQQVSHLPSSNMKNSFPTELPPLSNANTDNSNGNRSLAAIEEKIDMSAKLLPLRTVVTLDEKTYRPEYFDWPRFHHGVATGLRLSSPRHSPSRKGRGGNELGRETDTSFSPTRMVYGSSTDYEYLDDGLLGGDKNDLCWLFYVEPEELNVFHGGLIFGLGLNGHLLPNSRWYRYITQTKCSLVTIGFILGTCVTFRGTKNSEITKILSVHVPALLNSSTTAPTAGPLGSNGAINTSYGFNVASSSHWIRGEDTLMTSSCLFGFGLIYMGSCDRYMISVMLNEIESCSKRANPNSSTSISGDASTSLGSCNGGSSSNMESALALAAGFALGFIALGKGGNVSKEVGGLSDTQLSDTLYNYITGQSINTNTTKSSPGVSAPPASSTNATSALNCYQSLQQQRAERKYQHSQGTAGPNYNRGISNLLDITAPAATVAMGLIYLKTENHRMAGRLDICETTKPYLNYVRPDFLLMRTVSKNLILWKSITPSQEWINSQLPIFMRPLYQQGETQSGDYEINRSPGIGASTDGVNSSSSTPAWEDQVVNQAKYNILAGACLCLGLRFAGTHDTAAFECLLGQFDTFMKLASKQATSFQENITKSAIWICINAIATAAAMVMAGSGHEGLYRRLKGLHDRIPFGKFDTVSNINTSPSGASGATGQGNYGDHTASHMAMGLLFCGLGRYTLKTTNEAVAGLLCAFYPFYPLDPDDQRSHLQAFRHLWVIGMDQRWLTPFDCDTKLPCQVPLLITTANSSLTIGKKYTVSTERDVIVNSSNGTTDFQQVDTSTDDEMRGSGFIHNNTGKKDMEQETQKQQNLNECRVVAPSIVPNYDCIQSIQLDSSLYYPLNINMQLNSDYQQAICQSGILFVQKREKNTSMDL